MIEGKGEGECDGDDTEGSGCIDEGKGEGEVDGEDANDDIVDVSIPLTPFPAVDNKEEGDETIDCNNVVETALIKDEFLS